MYGVLYNSHTNKMEKDCRICGSYNIVYCEL